MIDQPPPSLRDRLTDALVEDRDPAFTAPLAARVRRERRNALLAAFLWRAGVVAAAGLIAVLAGMGAAYVFRLTAAALS